MRIAKVGLFSFLVLIPTIALCEVNYELCNAPNLETMCATNTDGSLIDPNCLTLQAEQKAQKDAECAKLEQTWQYELQRFLRAPRKIALTLRRRYDAVDGCSLGV